MKEKMALELVRVLQQPNDAECAEAFERAFELTKIYSGSANAQASAIPALFERLFELFSTGNAQWNVRRKDVHHFLFQQVIVNRTIELLRFKKENSFVRL